MNEDNKGFTLIELLFYISLSIVILFGTVDFILSINTLRQRGFVISEVENQGLRIVDVVTKAIRNSEGVNFPNGTGSVLSLVSSDNTKNPIEIRLNGKNLELVEGSASPYQLHNDQVVIESLYFTNLTKPGTKGLVKIEFVLNYNSVQNDSRVNYSRTFYGAASVR